VDDQPVIRVTRGTPTAEELAALVGALLSRPVPPPAAAPAPSRWVRSARPRAALRPGPDAWRASALPG
jgi:Acyl-CoA carboxylase epsilon subunit